MGLGALAVAGMVVSAAGAGMSAYGQYQAGKYQKKVAENNAKVAGYQATLRLERAQEQKRKLGLRIADIRGKGRVAFAAGNVALGAGSVFDWDEDLTAQATLDAESIDYNAALDVWGLENQARNYEAEGRLAKMRGTYGAISTGLQGAGNLMTQGAMTKKTFS